MSYFCVRKRILDFQFVVVNPPFWNLENVLSPKGAAKADPKVVQLFLLMCYPPKGVCQSKTEGGSFFYVLFLC